MNKKLEVRNLVLSFRTVNGKVQAVRDISFDLYEGETLSIVGESGSGKSVTSKAILGILAGNSIIEGGEIIYDGRDLLKISEDEFFKIRGDKIAMIFQDPLSSLNPIMRIGKQLTEAMLLKGKARQKSSRINFNSLLELLRKYMIEAGAGSEEEITAKCRNFDKFEFKHIELEGAYNAATEAATETVSDIENALFLIEKNAFEKDQKHTLTEIAKNSLLTVNDWVVSGADAERIKQLSASLKSGVDAKIRANDYSSSAADMAAIKDILKAALALEQPNFFSMGYYLTFSGQPLPQLPTAELNSYLHKYLDDNFMLDFIDCAQKAVSYAADMYNARKGETVTVLTEALPAFSGELTDKKSATELADRLTKTVDASIDPLEIRKDSLAYTFGTSIKTAVSVYFNGVENNAAETARYEKQQNKFDRLVEKGKEPTWKVAPAALVDLEMAGDNIGNVISRLLEHYNEVLAARTSRDYRSEVIAIIDYLKLNASGVVLKVTKAMAKHKALKLMDEVGIPEPRKRYRQYPFEFSGGMRQRIVIAIALAANPDILICDEPTTALDVTIQAQILELINKLKTERNLSIIFITHDLGVVANMADRIAVMYAGKIVEYGSADDIFYRPTHPYTWALLSSMPDLDTNDKLEAIPGTPPNMIYPPKGDAFAQRNKYALKIDFERQPPMFDIAPGHSAATWLLHPDAPKVEIPKTVSDRIARNKSKNGGADNA